MNEKFPHRRDVLRGALSAAGALLLPNQAQAKGGEELRTFLSDLRLVSEEMRSDRIRRDLAEGYENVIRRILVENTIQLPPVQALRNSPLNPERLFRYPLLVGSAPPRKGETQSRLSIVGAGTPQRQVYDLAEAVNGRLAHGNATPIASQMVITAGHVRPALERAPEVTMLSAANTDLAVAFIAGQTFAAENMVALPSAMRDTDVHGQFVVIPGIDPDATAAHRGMYKAYNGLAFQMTPAMTEDLITIDPNIAEDVHMMKWASESLCLIIPKGEGEPYERRSSTPRGAGMSGSPVFMLNNGEYVFVGVLWGVSNFLYKGKSYSLAFFCLKF